MLFFIGIKLPFESAVAYFLPKILLIIKISMASTATTINIPTPTPALNIPSIIEQLENDINTIKSINKRVNFFCMIN